MPSYLQVSDLCEAHLTPAIFDDLEYDAIKSVFDPNNDVIIWRYPKAHHYDNHTRSGYWESIPLTWWFDAKPYFRMITH